MEETQCEFCAAKGLNFKKRNYQLNFQEAILLCENKQCSDLFRTPDVSKLILPIDSTTKRSKASEKKPKRKTKASKNDITQEELSAAEASILLSLEGERSSENVQEPVSSVTYDATGATMNSVSTTSAQSMVSPTVADMCISSMSESNGGEAVQQLVQMPSMAALVKPDGTIDMTSLLNNHGLTNQQIVIVNDCAYIIEGGDFVMQDGTAAYQLQDNGAVITGTQYPQWTNKDALCWLDVTLNLLVHNNTLKRFSEELSEDSVVKKLLTLYQEALSFFNEKLSLSSNFTHSQLQEYDDQVNGVLERIRDIGFNHLRQKLKCNRGDEESPVFALPFLLKEENLMQHFSNHFQQVFKCDCCHFQQTRSIQKMVLTIDRVPSNFSMPNCQFVANCFVCGAPDQLHELKFDKLQPCVMIHFVNGLSAHDLSQYDFQFNQKTYAVTAAIQYKRNPNHFIAWIRNPKENTWMECDDLKPGATAFQEQYVPKLLPHECHIVVWEQLDEDLAVGEGAVIRDAKDSDVSNVMDSSGDTHLVDHMYLTSTPLPSENGDVGSSAVANPGDDAPVAVNDDTGATRRHLEMLNSLMSPKKETLTVQDVHALGPNVSWDRSEVAASNETPSQAVGSFQPLCETPKLTVKNVVLASSTLEAVNRSTLSAAESDDGSTLASNAAGVVPTETKRLNITSLQQKISNALVNENSTVTSTSEMQSIQIGPHLSVKQNFPTPKTETPSALRLKTVTTPVRSDAEMQGLCRARDLLSGAGTQCIVIVVPDKSQKVDSTLNLALRREDAANMLRTISQEQIKMVVLPNATTPSNEPVTLSISTSNSNATNANVCLSPKATPAILHRNAIVRERAADLKLPMHVNGSPVATNGPSLLGVRSSPTARNGPLMRKPEMVVRAVEPDPVFDVSPTPKRGRGGRGRGGRGRGRGRGSMANSAKDEVDVEPTASLLHDVLSFPQNNLTLLSDVCQMKTPPSPGATSGRKTLPKRKPADGGAVVVMPQKKSKTFESYPIRSKKK